ncbi:MAG: response regulator [Ignavibacteriae bacterium]|nr:response regulator [Ignavibacteriota bacterium]
MNTTQTQSVMNTTFQKRLSILIVEDEQLVRWSLSHALSKAGFNITTVGAGDVAMEKLQSAHYDLVITDIDLPKMSGYDVAAQVKNYCSEIPVILTSAIGEGDARLRIKKDCVDSFIEKPFDLNEVTEIVTRLLSIKNEE